MGCRVSIQRGGRGSGSEVSGFRLRVWWCGVRGSRVSGFGFQVSDLEFRISVFEFRVSGFGFQISGFGFRVSDFRFRISGHPGRKQEEVRLALLPAQRLQAAPHT